MPTDRWADIDTQEKNGEIQRILNQARPGDGAKDTFLGESGLSGLGTLLGQGYQAVTQHPVSQYPSDLWNTLKNVYQGQATETSSEQQAAKDSWNQGGPSGVEEAARHLVGSIPVVGHPIAHGIHNIQTGNLGGLSGDILSLLGGDLAKEGAEGLGAIGNKTGQALLEGSVGFPKGVSLDDAAKARQLMLDAHLPAGKGSIAKIGRIGQPGTLMEDLETQIAPHVTGASGAQPVDVNTVLRPAMKYLAEILEDRTPDGLQHVSDFIDELQGWKDAHPQGLTVEEAQGAKRAMYKRVADSQYADNASSIPAAPKLAKEMIARGLKDAVNEKVPQVAQLNDQMHSAIQLQDALSDLAKQKPNIAKDGLIWALGITAGDLANAHGMMPLGTAGLAMLAARQALNNPGIATRLAIAFGESPKIADAVRMIPKGAVAGVSNLPSAAGRLGIPPVQAPPQQ